jgi:hypothetical protein
MENHPVCVGFGGFAIFFYAAATPPCGSARRGISLHLEPFPHGCVKYIDALHQEGKPSFVSNRPPLAK